jgi:hypothetical protein
MAGDCLRSVAQATEPCEMHIRTGAGCALTHGDTGRNRVGVTARRGNKLNVMKD